MRTVLLSALATLLVAPASPDAQARGRVSNVTAVVAPGSNTVEVVLTGRNPCPNVILDYGNGATETLPIGLLPATLRYDYPTAGTYRIVAQGVDDCDGRVSDLVTVAAGRGGLSPSDRRFTGLDRDGDGVITRSEWRGNARSFDVHDWNGDGVLSGPEVRTGARAVDPRDRELDDPAFRTWTFEDFRALDRDGNGRLTPDEWHFARAAFWRADTNRDNTLDLDEFVARDVDDAFPTVMVDPRQRWTNTRVVLQPGDVVSFDAAGVVQLNAAGTDPADPSGARDGRRAPASPLPGQPAGALIARIDDGPAFLVGDSRQPFRVARGGVLYLSVNDDHLADNSGAFTVVITVS